MKVKGFTKEDKKFITAYDVEKSRDIIRDMKEDESTPADYLKTAVKCLQGVYHADIIQAEAKTACNRRVYDAYSAGSGDLDIYVDGLAKVETYESGPAYVEIGAYLSDIWQLTGDQDADMTTTAMFYTTWFTK